MKVFERNNIFIKYSHRLTSVVVISQKVSPSLKSNLQVYLEFPSESELCN